MNNYFEYGALVLPFSKISRIISYDHKSEEMTCYLENEPNLLKAYKIPPKAFWDQLQNYKTWLISQDKPTMLL
jgi:spore coat polysaccharide biosynthesis protein SpsF (cytidylyltransferase family)